MAGPFPLKPRLHRGPTESLRLLNTLLPKSVIQCAVLKPAINTAIVFYEALWDTIIAYERNWIKKKVNCFFF